MIYCVTVDTIDWKIFKNNIPGAVVIPNLIQLFGDDSHTNVFC